MLFLQKSPFFFVVNVALAFLLRGLWQILPNRIAGPGGVAGEAIGNSDLNSLMKVLRQFTFEDLAYSPQPLFLMGNLTFGQH